MTRNLIAAFGLTLLVAACAQPTEEPVELEDTIDIVTEVEEVEQSAAEQLLDTSIVPGSREDFLTNVGDTVLFDYDKSDLTADAILVLNRQSNWLVTYDSYTITIEGHADERGTEEYNIALGERRAQTVNDYLVANGVDPARSSIISFGEMKPALFGSSEVAYSRNRRSQTVLD